MNPNENIGTQGQGQTKKHRGFNVMSEFLTGEMVSFFVVLIFVLCGLIMTGICMGTNAHFTNKDLAPTDLILQNSEYEGRFHISIVSTYKEKDKEASYLVNFSALEEDNGESSPDTVTSFSCEIPVSDYERVIGPNVNVVTATIYTLDCYLRLPTNVFYDGSDYFKESFAKCSLFTEGNYTLENSTVEINEAIGDFNKAKKDSEQRPSGVEYIDTDNSIKSNVSWFK